MPSLAIVPAAGRSRRFGSQKLLADVGGEPLLNRTLRAILDAGVGRAVVVTAPHADLSSVALLADSRVSLATNPDPDRGMLSSIQAGLAHASGDPILVLPADMPFVAPGTIALVRDECIRRLRAVIPVSGGLRGHPVAFPGTLRQLVLQAPAEVTLKDALGSAFADADELAVDDPGVLRDVDRREDLEIG
jgi:molybdenum cofactor cytidylyltransferase